MAFETRVLALSRYGRSPVRGWRAADRPFKIAMSPYFGLDGDGQLRLRESTPGDASRHDALDLDGSDDALGPFSASIWTGALILPPASP